MPRFSEENIDANVALVRSVIEVAGRRGATPGQVALAWVLAQGDDVVPIPGTKRRTYLLENIAAADLVLSDEDLVLLDQALPVGVAHGERYPEQTMAAIDR